MPLPVHFWSIYTKNFVHPNDFLYPCPGSIHDLVDGFTHQLATSQKTLEFFKVFTVHWADA
jgi:hypothetical protein